jgi:hypothetical protein
MIGGAFAVRIVVWDIGVISRDNESRCAYVQANDPACDGGSSGGRFSEERTIGFLPGDASPEESDQPCDDANDEDANDQNGGDHPTVSLIGVFGRLPDGLAIASPPRAWLIELRRAGFAAA